MSSTFSPSIHLEEPGLGDYNNGWNVPVNSNFTIIDQKFGVISALVIGTSNLTLTNVTAAFWGFSITGVLTTNQVLTLPSGVAGTWIVSNATTGAHTLTVKGSGGDTGVAIPQNTVYTVNSNGSVASLALSASAIDTALGYVPANKAGDTFSGAVTFSAGITVSTNGVAVTAGDLTLTSGNVTLTSGNAALTSGNLTLSNGTLSVSGGAATFNNGATVASGLTVSSGTSSFGTATATTVASTDNSTNLATTSFVNDSAAVISAGMAFGAIGTYCSANSAALNIAPGATTAGSSVTVYYSGSSSTAVISGTWQFMGASRNDGSGGLWKRTI